MTLPERTTIEWFGATTYRVKTRGLTIFLDAWLDRPASLPVYISTTDVTECDYIFISHAHFDHLPGADRIALRTGATIIGNGEAISVMRAAGVPPSQLIPISGGERIPLGNSGIIVHPYPSLHCLLPPGDHISMPEVLDTGTVYLGREGSTLDVTQNMTRGFGHICSAPDAVFANASEDFRVFREWLKDREANKFSFFDGGQIMYNFLIPTEGTLLWSAHLGAYEGVLRSLSPKPDVAILAIAGRANLDGRPFQGSAAEFMTREVEWLGEPRKVVFCLQDEQPLNPKRIDTKAARELLEERTGSTVWDLVQGEVYELFEIKN